MPATVAVAPLCRSGTTPTSTDQGADAPGKTVVMDSQGDLSITVHGGPGTRGTKEFIVNSRVLTLASPMFSVMLGPHFKEGSQLRGGSTNISTTTRAAITLNEDDPYAMELLFSILHHRVADMPLRLEPRLLADVAIQADKYDCIVVFRPWALHWCQMPDDATQEDIGYVLLAAHLLQAPSLDDLTLEAAALLNPTFVSAWGESEILNLLPDATISWLANQIEDALEGVQECVQASVMGLQDTKQAFETPAVVCARCQYTTDFPWANMRCLKCSADYQRRLCTAEHRMGSWMELLQDCELWPSVGPSGDASLADIVGRVGQLRSSLRHKCVAAATCPLFTAIDDLDGQIRARLDTVRAMSVDTSCVYRRD